MMNRRLNVLFLCTGNSCRSQMAEGWTRHLLDEPIAVASAGVEVHGLNPLAVKAMAEAGVDIAHHRSKLVDEFMGRDWDAVITVCGNANERCPVFRGRVGRRIHKGFDDPPALARGAGTEEDALIHYRRVRDEIRRYVEALPQILTQPEMREDMHHES